MKRLKHLISYLSFVPDVLTNAMNLFPILLFTHLFTESRDRVWWIIPLLLYYGFKTMILFLLRFAHISTRRLLEGSIYLGIIGVVIGSFSESSLVLASLSGITLGICSGTLFPSYLTVTYHEGYFGQSQQKKEAIPSLVYAGLLFFGLFKAINYSLMVGFLYLVPHLLMLAILVSFYPDYEGGGYEDYPSYSVPETLAVFFLGFLTVFILKGGKKVGSALLLPGFFTFLILSLLAYTVFIWRVKPTRYVAMLPTKLMIFKGMLTNFILVFCTFHQTLIHGRIALYIVYFSYLVALILASTIQRVVKKYLPEVSPEMLSYYLLFVSFILLLNDISFYWGVFLLSVGSSQFNQLLNRYIYNHSNLPRDIRLLSKYRLNNIGSILQQVMMMGILGAVSLVEPHLSIGRLFYDYSYHIIQDNKSPDLFIAKLGLLLFFSSSLFYLKKEYKKNLS